MRALRSQAQASCLVSPFSCPAPRSLKQDPSDSSKAHKGYGMAEFKNPKAAERARHQLNGMMLGGRPLQVARPGNAGGADAVRANPGVAPEVGRVTGSMTPYEQWLVVSQLRELANSKPELARRLLGSLPQLATAGLLCLHSQGMLGGGQAPGATGMPATPQGYSGASGSSGAGLLAPPAGAPAPADPASAAQGDALRSVLHLTEEQLAAMPAEHRQEAEDLRKAFKLSAQQVAALPPAEAARVQALQSELREGGHL